MEEAFSIMAISYIPMQLLEHIMSQHFHTILHAFNSLQIQSFTLLPSTSFLCLLDEALTTTMHSQNIRIYGHHYNILVDKAQTIVLALKNINSKAEWDAANVAEDEDCGKN